MDLFDPARKEQTEREGPWRPACALARWTSSLALDDMLRYVNENADVWEGWTYWAAGPWWGDYQFTLEPLEGVDRPQMAVLQPYLLPPCRVYLPAVLARW